jgi:hypothetical protein
VHVDFSLSTCKKRTKRNINIIPRKWCREHRKGVGQGSPHRYLSKGAQPSYTRKDFLSHTIYRLCFRNGGTIYQLSSKITNRFISNTSYLVLPKYRVQIHLQWYYKSKTNPKNKSSWENVIEHWFLKWLLTSTWKNSSHELKKYRAMKLGVTISIVSIRSQSAGPYI